MTATKSTSNMRLIVLACAASCCSMATAAGTSLRNPLPDPWVPQQLRKAATVSPSQGADLRAQIERKLRDSFDAADVERRGSVTLDEAKRGGLGLVAANFDRIDTARTGRVSFEDVKRYLRAQGGNL